MSTPGPRKFLPSSNSQNKTPKPTWRTPGPATKDSRSSSSLKQSQSSQFAKTPRFLTSRAEVDDIDVSFEDGRSSPTELKAQRHSKRNPEGEDTFVDEDSEVDPDRDSTQISNVKPVFQSRTSTRKSSRPGDAIVDVKEDDFPQPIPKRLKSTSKNTKHYDAILISSSGSDDDNHYDEPDSTLNQPSKPATASSSDSDLDALLPSSPISDHANHPSTSKPPRFKPPTFPTSNHLPRSKPTFKPPLPPQSTATSTQTPLPDTFSPSRRRGKRDYIPGGYADTVRNWVLDLSSASVISTSTAVAREQSQQQRSDSNTLRVTRIQHDVDGRCATVLDESGAEHLLVSQGPGRDEASAVRVGDVVEVVGGEGMRWRLQVGGRAEGDVKVETERERDGDGRENIGGREAEVCVLWKVRQ